jgi:integrase
LWAARQEVEMDDTRRGAIPKGKTFGDLLERYADEVSPTKRGGDWEVQRIRTTLGFGLSHVPLPITRVKLTDLNETHVAVWRDQRLAVVSPATVTREWNLLSSACSKARREWKWLRDNPFIDVRRPPATKPRDRRPTQDEIDAILLALRCDPQITPVNQSQRVGFMFLLAIETAMRAGEMAGLKWSDIHARVAHLPLTKNGHPRDVPLSVEALRLLSLIPRSEGIDKVFDISSANVDALFRKAKAKAGVADLHFHDSRAEALSRMATPKANGGKGIDVMTLAKISGHRDIRILLNTYYRTDAESLADLLG